MFSSSKNLLTRSRLNFVNGLRLNSYRKCTDFVVAGGSGSSSYAVVSRTMEFGDMLVTDNMTVQQKGKLFNYGGLEKTNDCGYLTINGTLIVSETEQISACLDGFNEHGLSCDMLFFPRSIGWPKTNTQISDDRKISADNFLSFILGNCKSIDDVRDSLSEFYVFGDDYHNKYWTGHYQICDPQGNAIVVEYENGNQNIYDSVGVMTNEPRYSYHLENLHQYCHLTNFVNRDVQMNQLGHGAGLIGLPGDLTPPSRFVRAYLAKTFLSKEDIVKNSDDAIIESNHIINSVDIVRGMAKGYISETDTEGELDFTQWSAMKDLINKQIYFREYDSLNWNKYDFCKELNKLSNGESSVIEQFQVEKVENFKRIRNMLKSN